MLLGSYQIAVEFSIEVERLESPSKWSDWNHQRSVSDWNHQRSEVIGIPSKVKRLEFQAKWRDWNHHQNNHWPKKYIWSFWGTFVFGVHILVTHYSNHLYWQLPKERKVIDHRRVVQRIVISSPSSLSSTTTSSPFKLLLSSL